MELMTVTIMGHTMSIMSQARLSRVDHSDKEVRLPAVSVLAKWLLLDLVLMARNVLTK